MSSAPKEHPDELDCLMSQMSRDLALALRALETLRHSGHLSGLDRGLVSQLTWNVTATQFNLTRVQRLVKEPPEA